MKRVTGLGGVFIKVADPDNLIGWYRDHLGVEKEDYGASVNFEWRHKDDPEKTGMTVLSLFPEDTQYFGPKNGGFMLNFRVDDMDALLNELTTGGVEVNGREDSEYGRFAWITDPEGNRVELWEPPKE